MKSPKLVSFVIIGMAWCVAIGSLFGQVSPPKASSYTFLGVVAGTTFDPGTGQYTVEDFLSNWVNQNDGQITVRAWLDADDPTYLYAFCGGEEVLGDREPCVKRDTCRPFEDDIMPRMSAASHNYYGLSISINSDCPKFVGKLIVQSLGGQQFYVTSPNLWKVSASNADRCQAYRGGWETASWQDVLYWDTAAWRLISAYANTWHNDGYWNIGWNSRICLRNNTPNDEDVWIVYVTDYGGRAVSLDPIQNCAQNFLSEALLATIPAGQPQDTCFTLFEDIMQANPNHTLGEDGFFWVQSTAGSSLSQFDAVYVVFPNLSGVRQCGIRPWCEEQQRSCVPCQ